MLQISLQQEYVAHIGSFLISNSLFTTGIVSLIILLAALLTEKSLNGIYGEGLLQRSAEMVIEPLWHFVHDVLEDEKIANAVFPFIATFFIFIFFGNLVEVLPGFL